MLKVTETSLISYHNFVGVMVQSDQRGNGFRDSLDFNALHIDKNGKHISPAKGDNN